MEIDSFDRRSTLKLCIEYVSIDVVHRNCLLNMFVVTRSLIELQEKFISIHKIKKDIDNGIIADEIVKYIAPKFYFSK